VTNAVRPELSLTAWCSASNDKGGEFNIGMIENVGQDPACTIMRDLRVAGRDDDPNCAFLPTEVIMLLPKGERRPRCGPTGEGDDVLSLALLLLLRSPLGPTGSYCVLRGLSSLCRASRARR
jgi:hypothetical protein